MIHRRVSAAQGGGEAAAGQTELAKLRTGRLLGEGARPSTQSVAAPEPDPRAAGCVRPGTYGKVVLCDAPGSPGGASATYCLKIIPLYPNTAKRKCVPALCVLAPHSLL